MKASANTATSAAATATLNSRRTGEAWVVRAMVKRSR
jgi:hypothetical protein